MTDIYLTLDIGASSGRLYATIKEEQIIRLEEISRFKNTTYLNDKGLFWDFGSLFFEIINSIKKAINKYPNAKSIGVDTWGVDYGYIDENGLLLENPRCYRDQRAQASKALFHQKYPQKQFYQQTGTQQLPFNTIYQIYDDYLNHNDIVKKAKHILLIPDLISYYLTGALSIDLTNASTTGLLDAKKRKWIDSEEPFFKVFSKFPKLVKPSTIKGYIKKELDLNELPVISICSHDTASAFISVKKEEQQAIISSGTWSLVGKIIDKPILTKLAFDYNFTNELGMFNHTRFLKNVMGLWIINQIKDDLENHQVSYSFFELEKKAISAQPFQYFIDPDDSSFLEPGQMIQRIKTYIEKTNQGSLNDLNTILRTVYESLAFKYRLTIEQMETITNDKIHEIMIIGGGNQSDILNQFTANLTNRKIIIGPTEATVLGNAIAQMYYFKDIKSIKTGQNMIASSFEQTIYEPEYCIDYEKAFEKFKKIIGKGDEHDKRI